MNFIFNNILWIYPLMLAIFFTCIILMVKWVIDYIIRESKK